MKEEEGEERERRKLSKMERGRSVEGGVGREEGEEESR